mgnify:CR=1 FL=1
MPRGPDDSEFVYRTATRAKALDAVRGASWFGAGPGEGQVKYALPDAHSDFVFAVIADEVGLGKTIEAGLKAGMGVCAGGIFGIGETESDRIDMALEPACVTVCPTEAIIPGDFDDPSSKVSRLKAEGGNQTPEAKRETARQFEAMFVQMMLKSMREATPRKARSTTSRARPTASNNWAPR